jgi:selenocysteine lyase/cysteine desulfurase
MEDAFDELERGVHAALETYSNVHRGSGHNSIVSTHLFEQARGIVLEHLGLKKGKWLVVFCTPRRAEALKSQLAPGSCHVLSSADIALPLGVRALAVERGALPRGIPVETGGGTARLVSPGWVIWAKAPDRLEAGTPAIVNVIAFARALRLGRSFDAGALEDPAGPRSTASEILRRDELEQCSGRELLAQLRRTLIGRDVSVPTAEGPMRLVNLDNGASTRTFAPIWDAVRKAWRQPRLVQQEIVQEAKSICAEILGAPPSAYDVIFTSNTTEGINLVAGSLHRETEPGIEPVVLNTFLEHNSNELPWRMLPGFSLIRLPVDPEGFVDPDELEVLLEAYNHKGQHGNKRIKLLAVSGASNVLGTFNDLAELGRIAHRFGVRVLVDAAQLVAHRQVDMEACGIDYLAFSAHKVYAPFGSGALVVKKGLLDFSPDELELIRSSGEENVGGIAALGKALVLLQRIGLDAIQEEEQALTKRALLGLAQVPGLTIYGTRDPDSPRFAKRGGVIAFGLKGRMPSRLARALAERGGIGVRYGCHCAHLLIKRLLGVPPWAERLQGLMLTLLPRFTLPGLVRVSLGIENTDDDVDRLLQTLNRIASGPRGGKPTVPQETLRRQMEEFARAAAQRVYGRSPAACDRDRPTVASQQEAGQIP